MQPSNECTFLDSEMATFAGPTKIGLIATINDQSLPHITFIPNIQPRLPDNLIWGQLMSGQSKKNIQNNPRCGFCMLTLNKQLITGKALWTHAAESGKELDYFNSLSVYRYNAYFNLSKVHFMKSISINRPAPISNYGVFRDSLLTVGAKLFSHTKKSKPILNFRGRKHFNSFATYCFIAFIDNDGYPKIIPLLQSRALGSNRIIFSTLFLSPEIRSLQKGRQVALYGMSTHCESLLVRGEYLGISGICPFRFGTIEISWVYNSNPPIHGQIYPKVQPFC